MLPRGRPSVGRHRSPSPTSSTRRRASTSTPRSTGRSRAPASPESLVTPLLAPPRTASPSPAPALRIRSPSPAPSTRSPIPAHRMRAIASRAAEFGDMNLRRFFIPSGRQVLVVSLLLGLVLALRFLPVLDAIFRALEYIHSLGNWGIALMLALFVPVALFGLPSWTLLMSCGAVYGVPLGAVVALLGYHLGSIPGFLAGRYLVRQTVLRFIESNRIPRVLFRSIDDHPFRMVVVCRVSPFLPYSPCNYVFGVSTIPLWLFVSTSAISIFPYVFLNVTAGAALGGLHTMKGHSSAPSSAELSALFALGVAVTLVAVVWLSRYAKRILDEETERENHAIAKAALNAVAASAHAAEHVANGSLRDPEAAATTAAVGVSEAEAGAVEARELGRIESDVRKRS